MKLKIQVTKKAENTDLKYIWWDGLTDAQKEKLGIVERQLDTVESEIERVSKILKCKPVKKGKTYVWERE